ncbi:MAG: hypothetical protein HYV27_10005 [Candidatus Hydrogenedentes bacterium]|nr:hypothetical protein [Candidatus Hydrogenedentota bacterium]
MTLYRSAIALLFLLNAAAASPDETPEPPAWATALSSAQGTEEEFVNAFRAEEFARLGQMRELGAEIDMLARGGKPEQVAAKKAQAQQVVDEISAAYAWALGKYPENARLLTYHGEFLYDVLGKQEEAIVLWNRSLTFDGKLSLTYNDLSLHYAHIGQYKLSLSHLDKALDLDGKNPDFQYNLAQFYLVYGPQTEELRGWNKKKVYKEGMKASKRASALSPDDFELVKDYAVNYFAGENFGVEVNWKDAAKAWQEARAKARNKTDIFYAWLNEARSWIRAGKDSNAMAALNEALKIFPDSEVAQKLLGELELKQEKASKKGK